jgi:hypothetical protein
LLYGRYKFEIWIVISVIHLYMKASFEKFQMSNKMNFKKILKFEIEKSAYLGLISKISLDFTINLPCHNKIFFLPSFLPLTTIPKVFHRNQFYYLVEMFCVILVD